MNLGSVGYLLVLPEKANGEWWRGGGICKVPQLLSKALNGRRLVHFSVLPWKVDVE